MDPYWSEWVHLLARFVHVVTAIAWIGASFYFVWLDNALAEPPQWKKDKGVKGDLWAIHGGGFYEVAKYRLAPEVLPTHLHWFKWEAYSTWLSGMFLLGWVYYLGASSYMVDPAKAELLPWQAVALGVATLVLGWLVYEGLCRTSLVNHGLAFGVVCLSLIAVVAYGLSLYLGDRAAYIHIGALMGTCMAANVFTTIMPSQRALVAAVEQGQAPDPQLGINARRRSIHNNYATLPVLFIMLSNHYPMTYGHAWGWLMLVALIVIGAWARHYFNLKNQGQNKPWVLVSAFIAFVLLAVVAKPERPQLESVQQGVTVTDAQALAIVQQRCSSCHADAPTDDMFTMAPLGYVLETLDQMRASVDRIEARSILSHDMPFMNKTGMTDEERALLAQWITSVRAGG
ncbi:MAG: urate hydroxylase PuuD [Pontibacterium sp.]